MLRMKVEKGMKRWIIISLVGMLLISCIPGIQANANISVIDDGLSISTINDYRIEEFDKTLKYKLRENWDVKVDGVIKGQMALFVPPDKQSDLGRTMAHRNTLRQWGEAFNGNPQFVVDRMLGRPTTIHRMNDSNDFFRYYSVYIARESGAKVATRTGLDGQGYLEVTTSPFPLITKLQAPAEVTQNTDFNVTFSGVEYNPYNSEMSYSISVNGSPKATGFLNSSQLGALNLPETNGTFINKIEPIQISGTGTYTIELALTDGIQRTSVKTTTVNVKAKPPTGQPYLEIEPSVQTIQVGEIASYKAYYYDANGKKTDVTTNTGTTWTSFSSATASLQAKGQFKGLKEGNLSVRAQNNGLEDLAQLVVANNLPSQPPVPNNEPPTVIINGPTEVMIGEEFCLQANATDPDGDPLTYSWNFTGDGSISGSNGCGLHYGDEGLKEVTVTVSDGKDSATDTHYINVIPPKPTAAFTWTGTNKENRKVTLNPSDPYNGRPGVIESCPMVEEKWKIIATNPANQIYIKTDEDLNSNLSYQQAVDILMKVKGDYKIIRYVKNCLGLDDTVEMILTIQPDFLPVANFFTAVLIYRDDIKQQPDHSKATIKLSDRSYSRDDSIVQRIWTYQRDDNNDGVCDGDEILISNANDTEVQIVGLDKVGKYCIKLRVIEQFDQPTMDNHVVPDDRRWHQTDQANSEENLPAKPVSEWVVNLDNLAPNVSYDVQKQKYVNLDIALGYTPYTKTDIETKLNTILKPKLAEKGIDYALNFTTFKESVVPYATPLKVKEGVMPSGLSYNGYTNKVLNFRSNYRNGVSIDYGYTDGIFSWTLATEYLSNGVITRGQGSYALTMGNPFNGHYYTSNSNPNGGTWTLYESDETGKNVKTHQISLPVSYSNLVNPNNLNNRMAYYFSDANTLWLYTTPVDGTETPYIFKVDLLTSTIVQKTALPYPASTQEYAFYNDSLIHMFNWGFNPTLHQMITLKNGVIGYPGTGEAPIPQERYKNGLALATDNSNGDKFFVKDSSGKIVFQKQWGFPGKEIVRITDFNDGYILLSSREGYIEILNDSYITVYKGQIPNQAYYDAVPATAFNDNEFIIGSYSNWQIYSIGEKNEFKLTNSNDMNFTAVIDNQAIQNERLTSLESEVKRVGSTLVGIGNSTNQPAFQSLFTKGINGTFINNTNIDTSIQELANYIIAQLEEKEANSKVEMYITLDEQVEYFTTYFDFENDPKRADRWRYDHVPGVFENDMGLDSQHLKDLNSPILQFTKVGRYQPFYSAQDDPIFWGSTSFPLYQKWAKDADNWYIYVHRKPVPEFDFTINASTGAYTIKNAAYDLDKESINNGFGPGLQSQKWSWRLQGQTEWIQGLPTSPLERKVYEVQNTVVDFQNRKEGLVKALDATGVNKPPVALFEPMPSVVQSEENFELENYSYDPNGDDLTAKWYFKFKEQTDTSYSQFLQGEKKAGVENIGWQPVTNFLAEGTYDVKLVVTDSFGLSDSTIRQVTVLPNNSAPIAGFTYPDPVYIGDTINIESTATDPDGDPLQYTYDIKKPNGDLITIQTGNPMLTSNGKVSIKADQHPSDLGTWEITQTVSDGKEQATATGQLTVLDQVVDGLVNHTAAWEENRQKYNLSVSGNINEPRESFVFFPGEKFMLNAAATVTAIQVNVTIDEYPQFSTNLQLENGQWVGNLWHRDMIEMFKNETLHFRFNAIYQNGWTSEDVEPVLITDDKYWREHSTY